VINIKNFLVAISAMAVFSCASQQVKENSLVEIRDQVTVNGITHVLTLEPEKRASMGYYLCDLQEQIKFEHGGKKYELINLISKQGKKAEDCQLDNFTENTTMRYLFVGSETNSYADRTQLMFRPPLSDISFLPHWRDVRESLASLDKNELVVLIDSYDTRFDSMAPIDGVYLWFKTRRNKDNGQNTYVTWSPKGYQKSEMLNGDKKETCSKDGETWRKC